MFLFFDLSMASLDPMTGCPLNPFIGISIFDCPEQSQTSPIRTLLSVTAFPSLMEISNGPPADGVVIISLHFPDASVLVLYLLLSHVGVTVIEDPGADQPQTGTSAFC